MIKTTKVCSGIYEATVNGVTYVIERFETESTGTLSFYWSWYVGNGYKCHGEDAYATKREAIEALEAYLADVATDTAQPNEETIRVRAEVRRIRRERRAAIRATVWDEGYDYSVSVLGRYIRVRRDTYTVRVVAHRTGTPVLSPTYEREVIDGAYNLGAYHYTNDMRVHDAPTLNEVYANAAQNICEYVPAYDREHVSFDALTAAYCAGYTDTSGNGEPRDVEPITPVDVTDVTEYRAYMYFEDYAYTRMFDVDALHAYALNTGLEWTPTGVLSCDGAKRQVWITYAADPRDDIATYKRIV